MPRELKHFLIALPIITLVAFVITIWLGMGRSSPGPTASDDPGETLRIAAVSPALGVIVRDLGLESSIVARHGFDIVLDPSVPVVGDQAGLDYEELIASRPTHVLLEWGRRELPPKLGRLADERGWVVSNFDLRTLDEIVATTAAIEEMFGVEQDSRPSAELPGAWSKSEVDLSPAGRVLLLGATQPAGALGPGSYHHQMLLSLGARTATPDGNPWIEFDAEDIRRLAPDSIVLFRPRAFGTPASEPEWEELAAALGRIAELDIPAVRARRVALIDNPAALLPSTAAADVAARLREILERWSR